MRGQDASTWGIGSINVENGGISIRAAYVNANTVK